MGAAAIGVAQKEDDEQRIDEQDIFYRMVLLALVPFDVRPSRAILLDDTAV